MCYVCIMFFAMFIMPPPPRKGGNKRCFCQSVRQSVHLSVKSVAYIANNSRTQRPSVPKFGRKVPHLRCDSHVSFKVKRSNVRVTRPIDADTHRAPCLPNGKTYELQTRCTMEDDHPHQPHAMISKVKSQGHKITWSLWAVLAQWPINRKRLV